MANPVTDLWFWATTGKTATAIEEETARNNEILAKRDADLIARGKWDADAQAAHRQNMETQYEYWDNTGGQVAEAAGEGAIEGLETMQRAVRAGLGGVARFSLKATLGWVPWWLWIAGAAYLAFRLGLLGPALRSLKSKLPA